MTTPDLVKVKAIDVKPHRWALWCTVGDSSTPFANVIESRKWSDDGRTIWFLLGTHNAMKAAPDEELELVPVDPGHDLSGSDKRDEATMAKRPTTCATCGSMLKSEAGR